MPNLTAIRWPLVASFSLLLGCGSVLGSPDGGGGGGGGSGGSSEAARACSVDSDCTISEFARPVASVAACYCVACAGAALNRATAESYRAQWTAACTQWTAAQPCPIYDCIAPPPVRCIAGLCTAGSQLPPATCPQDPASGCGDAAVRCGSACCKPNEWCDQLIGACRCGYGDGCGGDLLCGVGGPIGADSCGFICCGGSSSQGCPR
jgi:hypothetical protein